MTGNRKFYVVYTNHKNGFETEEVEFEPGEEISQATVKRKLEELHSGWYNPLKLNMVISWSEIIEEKEADA